MADEQRLFLIDCNKYIEHWDAATQSCIFRKSLRFIEECTYMDVTPGLDYIVCSDKSGKVNVYRTNSGKWNHQLHLKGEGGQFYFKEYGNKLVIGSHGMQPEELNLIPTKTGVQSVSLQMQVTCTYVFQDFIFLGGKNGILGQYNIKQASIADFVDIESPIVDIFNH